MKLSYIANIRLPTEKAHGLQVMRMCEAFAAAGADLTLIVPRRFNAIAEDPFTFYGTKKSFRIVYCRSLDLLWLPVFKKISFLLQQGTFAVASRLHLLFHRYDAIYTRDASVAYFSSFGRTPVYYEVHGIPAHGVALHRMICKRVRGLVAISDGVTRALTGQGIAPEKILVARDAVDLSRFSVQTSKAECRAQLGIPPEGRVFLYAGHLYPWKGAHTLAEASPLLKDLGSVYIVGGTAEDVRGFRARYRYASLRIMGWQDPARIPFWLKAADVLVLPTSGKEPIGAHYTSPLKLFEYMASGVPVVAADLPSIREIVGESEVEFFTADDSVALASAVRNVLSADADAENRAANARRKVQEFTWERRAGAILKFLQTHS